MGNRHGEGFDSNAPALKNVCLMPQWKISHPSKVFNQAFNPESHSELQLKRAVDLLLHQESLRRRQWHPTPVLLPGKSHGRRSLVGCSPWGRQELDTTERLLFYFSLSCTGEGNGNPLQCSCLENPRTASLVGCHLWGRTESDTTEVT